MKTFAAVAAIAGLASAASSGWGAPVYVTDVVTAYTTYCPSATMITHGGKTYTVTSATTLTITNCPCTITRPVTSSVSASSYCPTAVSSGAPKAPASSGAPAPPKPMSSSGYFPVVPTPTQSGASSTPTSYQGAANKAQVAGAGIVALMGLAAAL